MRHGILATRGGLAAVDKGEDGPPFTYFAHCPPLVPFGAAAAFLVLSVRD